MRILLATDAFPPLCGGSGWSTYELARGLRARRHEITIARPIEEAADAAAAGDYDGFRIVHFPAPAPRVPFVRNYVRNERLYPRLAVFLQDLIRRHGAQVVHAQHVLTGPPSIEAAHAAGVPAVCTVRDYWPVCYWGDLVRTHGEPGNCPACSPAGMLECLRPHAGGGWPLAVPAIPYMRANLRLKQRGLRRADVVIAVSRSVAADLRARAAGFGEVRIETIPNAVDVAAVRAIAASAPPPLPRPYALFVGKLAYHKGVNALVDVLRRSRLRLPLVVVGDGPDRAAVSAAAASAGVELMFPGWIDRDRVFQWLHHARVLIFPSSWPEPLSRVLIEASALGTPIAAMNTGGTPDIVVDGETGLLARSPSELAANVARLVDDAELSARIGAAARTRAETRFDVPVIVERMERLYEEIAAHRPGS